MPSGLRSITLDHPGGERINADNVIGIDESMSGKVEEKYYITTAVRCTREADIQLVSTLIENRLQPFKHKSSSIVRHGRLTPEERRDRVSSFIAGLADTSVTWAAIVSEGNPSENEQAAAAAMAVKKSITNGLSTGDVAHGCGETAVVHDGARDKYSEYTTKLCKQLADCCDKSFQKNICPVYLTYLQEADLIYPQSTAADYIAGYIRDRYENGGISHDWVCEYDDSWGDSAPQPDRVYQLERFQPVREAELRSRVIAWMTGRGIPPDPQPTGRDPYRDLVSEIENETVYEYLMQLE